MSLGLMAILAFVILTLLILQRQGMTQAINTLAIISIVVGFVMSVLGLLISFLQWHHPQPTDQPKPSLHALPQTLTLDHIEHSQPPSSPTGPQEQHVENNADFPPTIFAVFGGDEKLELVSKKSEEETNVSPRLAKKEKKLQA